MIKKSFPFYINTKTYNKFEKKYSQYFVKTPEPTQQCKNCMHYIIDKGGIGNCQLVEGDVIDDSWCRFWRTIEELTVFNHKYIVHPDIGEHLGTDDNVDVKINP